MNTYGTAVANVHSALISRHRGTGQSHRDPGSLGTTLLSS